MASQSSLWRVHLSRTVSCFRAVGSGADISTSVHAKLMANPCTGLPPPHSQSLPRECEDILRAQGVTPATIAILNGRIKVGVEGKDLDYFAERGWAARKDKRAAERLWKVGRRELGAAVVKVSSARDQSISE